MSKKQSITVGDMVGWNSSGGHAMGRVERIKRQGTLNIPDTKFTVDAEENDPAVLIRIYQNGEKTDTLVGHKMSTLSGFVAKYNRNHDDIGRFSSGTEGTGIGTNGDDNMQAMDEMDMIRPPRRGKRKLSAAEQTLLNRITDPAGNMVSRPGDNRDVYNLPFSTTPRGKGGVTGYVPNSGVTGQPGAAAS
jgi:hypothetical protein